MVFVSMICFGLVHFLKAIMGSVLKVFFYNFDLLLTCAHVLLEYLLDLVRLDYRLLIMGYIFCHDICIGGAVVFDQVGRLSEFAA